MQLRLARLTGRTTLPSMYYTGNKDIEVIEPADEMDNIVTIEGRVPLCSSFGNRIGSMEICENKGVKGLKCDALVLCSSYFLL
jgi:hypothetical protein